MFSSFSLRPRLRLRVRAALLLSGALAGCGDAPAPPVRQPPQTVSVVTVMPAEIAVSNQFAGRLAASRQAEVRAPVGQDRSAALATIGQTDPIYVDFSQPAAIAVQMRKAIRDGELHGLPKKDIPVHVILGDGSTYPRIGKLICPDRAFDPAADTIAMRAVLPNPRHLLQPGTYVRVALDQAFKRTAILIPRHALLRFADAAQVMVVNADNMVEAVAVTADTLRGDKWLVSAGLNGGEKVIVVNAAKMKAGTQVTPQERGASKPVVSWQDA